MKGILLSVLIGIFLTSFIVGGLIFLKNDVPRKIESQAETQETVSSSSEGSSSGISGEIGESELLSASDIGNDAVFSFAILGDTQRFDPKNSQGGYQQAVENIKKINPDLVFAVGDLVSDCEKYCEDSLESWKKILGALAPKTYAVMGNHDRTGGDSSDKAWQNAFDFPDNGPAGFGELTYSFDYGNSHFVILDSDKPEEHIVNKDQRNWLEADLANNKKNKIFVFFHEPAYPVSSKIGESLDVDKKERDALWDILSRYEVRAVFNGHEHLQSRKKIGNIYQFVFGNTDSFDHNNPKPGVAEYHHIGQGFGMIEINEDNIIVKTYSIQGELLDSFSLPN